MKTKKFVYTGSENLEAMEFAKNYNRYLINQISTEIGKGSDTRVLDFGAGKGTYADLLKIEDIVVDCLEPDESLKNELQKKGYKVYESIDEVKGEYDLIYALNVFEHIENDAEIFNLLSKKLKKGGILIIYVPAFQVLFSTMDKLVGHYRRYDLKMLENLANGAKIGIIRNHYCDPLGFLATMAFKASKNKSGVISPVSVKIYDRLIFPVSRLIEPIFSKIGGKNALLVVQR